MAARAGSAGKHLPVKGLSGFGAAEVVRRGHVVVFSGVVVSYFHSPPNL